MQHHTQYLQRLVGFCSHFLFTYFVFKTDVENIELSFPAFLVGNC